MKVEGDGIGKTDRELDHLTQTSKQTEKATDGLLAAFKRLIVPLLSIGTAVSALNKIKNTAVAFEDLDARLKTTTGSANGALVAMEALTDFATETPYALEQSVEAFIQLTNLGLTPSERALRSYGDTASAMGKQLSEMANAVGRAVAGEFDPLKSFGVSMKKDGDKITASFRGVSEEIRNDARSIEEYFIRLGEANFAGSMEERMKTLGGRIANLGDAWDQMFNQIAKAGAGDLMKEGVTIATRAIEEITAMLASGELQGYVSAVMTGFEELWDAVSEIAVSIWDALKGVFEPFGDEAGEVVDWVIDAFKTMPQNIATVIRAMGATFGMLHKFADIGARAVLETFKRYWSSLGETTRNLGDLMGDILADPLNARSAFTQYMVKQAGTVSNLVTDVANTWETSFEKIVVAGGEWEQSIVRAMDLRDKSIAKRDEELARAKQLREEYEKEKLIQEELEKFFGKGDRLAGFSKGGDTKNKASSEQIEDFKKLQLTLMDEEAAVALSYQKRLELIRVNTEAGSALRLELETKLNEQLAVEMDGAYQDKATRLEAQYLAEQTILQDALDRRLISEQEFQAKSRDNWNKYTGAITTTVVGGATVVAKKQLEMHSQVLGLAQDITGQLAGLAGENTAMAKAMFIASKGIAIAQAIVNTELAATRALAEGGIYMGIPMSSLIRGLGYASVALMAGTAVSEYQGKFADGGMISAGKFGMVHEEGFEFVRGPAQVTSAAATRDALGNGIGGSTTVNFNVINQASDQVEVEKQENSDGGYDLVIKKIRSQFAAEIRSGDGELNSSIQKSFGLRRTG